MRQQRYVFLNDSVLPVEQAHVSVDDTGYLLGDGVFETCGMFDGVPFLLDEHVKRLRAGLQFTQIPEPERLPDLAAILDQVVAANRLQDTTARARITVSRGVADTPTFLVSALAWTPPADLEDGVSLDMVREPVLASPWRQVKSTSRQASVLAGRNRAPGIYDSLMWNTRGVLTEGTYSNLFCVDEAACVRTPRLEDGCLAGVTRAAVLQVAREQGLETRETPLRPADLASMREFFLTSSMSSVVPVRRVTFPEAIPPEWDPRPAAGVQEWASPGPVTVQIRTAYRSWLKESTCRPR